MNQEKIGRFISECRKEKQLTQEQLAVQFTKTMISYLNRCNYSINCNFANS